jgi:hypothetical protein
LLRNLGPGVWAKLGLVALVCLLFLAAAPSVLQLVPVELGRPDPALVGRWILDADGNGMKFGPSGLGNRIVRGSEEMDPFKWGVQDNHIRILWLGEEGEHAATPEILPYELKDDDLFIYWHASSAPTAYKHHSS